MEHRILIIVGVILFMSAGLWFLVWGGGVGEAEGRTITVDDDAPDGGDGSLVRPYNRIQDALLASEDGDTIRVFEGIYDKNVIVNKSVSLIGNGSTVTIIDGGGVGDVVRILADSVNMSGFSVRGSGTIESGVFIESNYTHIFEINCSNNYNGITISQSSWISVRDTNCSSNDWNGIYVHRSANNHFSDNDIRFNDIGLYIFDSSWNSYHNNTFANNREYGVRQATGTEGPCRNNTFRNNSLSNNGKMGIYIQSNTHVSIDAKYNWWGDESGPYHEVSNPEGKGDIVSDWLLFDPWIGKPRTWYVDDDAEKGGNGSLVHPFNRIQDAIDASQHGETIRVFEGIYEERVIVNRSVSLIGNGSEVTTINANGMDGVVVTITADNVSMSGFLITGIWAEQTIGGILVISDNNQIFDNNCSYKHYGIRVSDGSDNAISNNICYMNGIGIRFDRSSNSTIINTTCLSNDVNIQIASSKDCVTKHNVCDDSVFSGIELYDSENCSITNTICSNSGGNGGISFSRSSNITLTNNTIFGNGNGIYLRDNSKFNTAHSNNICNNRNYGINATSNDGFTINVTENWWGDRTGPYHPDNNSQGKGNGVTNFVLFEPWLDDHGNLTYPLVLPDGDAEHEEPDRIPLYVLLGLLVALITTLAIFVRSPRPHSKTRPPKAKKTIPLEPSWDSSDVVKINGNMITCDQCQQTFDVPKDEMAIRVPCPNCGKYVLKP